MLGVQLATGKLYTERIQPLQLRAMSLYIQDVRSNVDTFCDECFKQASKLAEEVNVEPRFLRTVGRM